jgi:probable rRNA maturation factor
MKRRRRKPPKRMSRRPPEYRVEVLNHRGRIDARWVAPLCRKILACEGVAFTQLNIVATDNRYIRQLNRDYRGEDKATDVLAFDLQDREAQGGEGLLGEIYISCEKAQRQAKAYRHSFREEVRKLVAHGLLHLLGYDHRDDKQKGLMQEREGLYLTGKKVTAS